MILYFNLRYHTVFGETLWMSARCIEKSGESKSLLLPMQFLNTEEWELTYEIDNSQYVNFTYQYLLKGKQNFDIADGEKTRELALDKLTANTIHVKDAWNDEGDHRNSYYTAPFQEVLLKRGKPNSRLKPKANRGNTHIFRVKAPLLQSQQVVCISGNYPELGNWDKDNTVILQKEGDWWTGKINLTEYTLPVSYKYGIYDLKQKSFVRFEEGENRLVPGPADKDKVFVCHDGFVRIPDEPWKGAGVAVPVFSLRSAKGAGTGEFSDIRLLADWALETGIKMIQILPVNDTIANHDKGDSYPYAAISAFALNPLYLNVEKVAGKEDLKKIKALLKKKNELNSSPDLDYVEVIKFKLEVIKTLFQSKKETFLKSEDFKNFLADNKHWLVPYAAFCYLRDKYKTPDFQKWKTNSTFNEKSVQKLVSPAQKHFDEVAVFYFMQYHLHLQLTEAVEYAHSKGVVLKGDIPIGIYRYSCDAWMYPDLFIMEQQAGAPPDPFSAKGQNWGFPTYNWKRMQEDGFGWWKKRFEQMSIYFDAFRIDHILGFFRIWSVPIQEVDGDMGHFEPAIPLRKEELEHIDCEISRLTHPYITDAIIWELFNGDAEYIKSNFLDETEQGIYRFKPEFETQKQISEYFETEEKNERNSKIKSHLNDLVSNLIILHVPGQPEDEFHFRFSMQDTLSFKELDETSQKQLTELYNDFFYKRQDRLWEEHAMEILPSLKEATNMLIIGEDLGMVPDCVPDVMKRLGILSLEIQRMPKGKLQKFGNPAEAPYLSVVSPATHDMSTIRGWWEEDRELTQQFYNENLSQMGEAPHHCEAWINKAIVVQHLYSSAMWAVIQIQDLLGIDERLRRSNPDDERINIPADNKHAWKYRMHINLEDLLKEKAFNSEIKTYVQQSGR